MREIVMTDKERVALQKTLEKCKKEIERTFLEMGLPLPKEKKKPK
tara:strand:- start:2649 stop:2783 length:135 start_codon:yes stop_codon:yes gene_type:complete